MNHVYREGFSTLPNLKKVVSPFFISGNLKEEKKKSLSLQKCFLEHEIDDVVYEPICRFIVDNHPDNLEMDCFENLALNVTEDLAVHRMDGERDWLAATHICFPSNWSPEEKIGKNFEQIHLPIPGMDLRNSSKLVRASIFNGPFERYLWGLVFDEERNCHPDRVKKEFDIDNPHFYVKVETQLMVGFPSVSALLFILRQCLISEKDVDKPSLLSTLLSMSPEQLKYKSIPEGLITYLRGTL